MLDTNVLSELRKGRPHENVLRFFRDRSPTRMYISPLTLGELRKGAALQAKRSVHSAQALGVWVDGVEKQYLDRLLPVDLSIARIWGELEAMRTRPVVDTLLAATAIHHGLTLVTRNVKDVQDTPAMLHNPWLALL